MASFLEDSRIYQFNPYLDTLNADALIKVEMAKQDQFNQGVEKVQGYVNSVMGLPIAKQETRDYIQSKLTQLKNNISTSTTGDFSDMRLLNQIGGLTGRIANDPIVQNGVQAAARIQDAYRRRDEDRKAGKINPYNDQAFDDSVHQWMSDGRADSVFEGDYYSPVDYKKMFVDAWNVKTSHANSQLTQEDVRVNTQNGTVGVINQREHEGVSPDEVNSLWQQVMMDPSVQRQLSIESQQKFKNLDGEGFSNYLKASYQSSIGAIAEKVKQIQNDASLDKTIDARQATQYIQQLKKQSDNLVQSYNSIGQMIQEGNLNAAKNTVYINDLSSMFIKNYSWSKDKDQVLPNPLFDAQLRQAQFELQQQEFDYRKQHDRDELAYKYSALMSEGSKKKLAGANGSETVTHDYLNNQEDGNRGRDSFYNQLKQDKANYQQAGAEWIFKSMKPGKENPVKYDPATGTYTYNVDRNGIESIYKTREEADAAIRKQFYHLRGLIDEGKLKRPDLEDMFKNTLQPLTNVIQQKQQFAQQKEEKYKSILDPILSPLVNDGLKDEYQFKLKNGTTNISQQDIVDIATYRTLSGDKADKIKDKLISKLGIEAFDRLDGVAKGRRDQSGSEMYNALYPYISKLKLSLNRDNLAAFRQREEDFKYGQSSFIPTETVIHPKDANDEKFWQREFASIANDYKPSGSNKGNADDFLSLLNKDGKKEVKSYSIVHDQNTGQWALKVGLGKESETLPIDEKYLNDLGFKTTNDFWDKYGPSLYLSSNTTTDKNGTGESSSFIQDRDRNSKYRVRYHLEGDGHNNYSLRLWIRDNKTGQLLLSDENIGEIGDPAKVMDILNNPQYLRSDLAIDGLLAKYQK